MHLCTSADLANTPWAFASLNCLDAPMLTAIAASAITKVSTLDLYALTAVLDVLAHSSSAHALDKEADMMVASTRCLLFRMLRRHVAGFLRQLPAALQSFNLNAYSRCLVALRVASLGAVGTELLLNWVGVETPPLAFSMRAQEFLRIGEDEYMRSSKKGSGASSYASWHVHRVPPCADSDVQPVVGELKRRSGLLPEEEVVGQRVLESPGALRAVRLTTTSPHTDRRLCSEIRLLEDVRMALNLASSHGIHELTGEVNLQVSRPPCLSCAGAIVQFRLLHPKISFGVGF